VNWPFRNRSKLINIRKISVRALVLAVLPAIAALASAEPAKLQLCAACHGQDGSGAGFPHVPIIAGTPAAHLEEALYAYQDGARLCTADPAMCQIAATLSEADVLELAEHFGAMRRVSAGEEFDATLAQTGAPIHEKHCGQCHVMPDDEDVEYALGIPLHGQRSAYLKAALDAYLNGDRETLVPAMAAKLALLDANDIEALVNYYASYQP
jgi:cytochrome c553